MPDDVDHEVLDSPQALLQHLYEAHGVEEALDLDPATAPVQFWLRRHAELERAAGAPGQTQPRPAPHTQPGSQTQPRPAPHTQPGSQTQPRPAPRPAPQAQARPAPQARPEPAASPGPRYRPFADPLVEAVAAALVRRGLEERQVRRWIASYASPDRPHGRRGEAAVSAGFLVPVLDALAAQVSGAGGHAAPAPPTPPPPAPPPPAPPPPTRSSGPPPPASPPPANPLPAGPPAAKAPAAAPGVDADFMAIADVLQSRPRRGGRGRREAAAGAAAPAPPRETADHDDYMALADAVQRRRGGARR